MSPRSVAPPATVRTAVVLTHTHPSQTSSALRATAEAAARSACTLLATAEELEKHDDPPPSIERVEALPAEPDICIVLGGDGTILKGLRAYSDTEVPVFGVNFGTIGFLAAVEREQLGPGLDRAFAADFEVITMPALEATIDVDHPLALNDISLIRGPHSRVAELSYSLGEEEVGHVRCDGLVAATPGGSTGYNLANGGPILAWGVEGYVVSFVAPHTLTARALVVAPNDVLVVRNVAGRDPVDVAFDGLHLGDLESGGEMQIRFRDDVGRLAQVPGASFYQRIREKFGRLAH